MTRKVLIAFIVFTIFGIGVVFWFVQGGEEKSALPQIVTEEEQVKILFVGDIMLSRAVGRGMERRSDYLYPFRLVAEEIKSADVAFGNLEGPISARGKNQGSEYSFRADPRTAEGLVFAGFDVLSIANNHIWDWGELAIEDTITLLTERGIDAVGAGRSEEEANTAVVKDIRGTRIAFLAYTPLYPKNFQAQGASTGISTFDRERITAQIQELKDEVDIVVVSFHWGDEYQTKASASQRELARAFVDAGADLIIGHHPHVVQEVEKYKDSWIAYSLGNFVFDQTFSEETMKGLTVVAIINGKKVVDLEERQVSISRSFQPAFQE